MESVTRNLDYASQRLLARPLLIKTIQAGSIISLGVLTGVAACLHVWVIPVIRQARSTRTKLEQFRMAVGMGFKYLQPSSRATGIALALMTFVLSRSQSAVVQSRWKYYAAAMAVVIPLAPYEIYTIFPTNDRMYELDDELRREGKDDFHDERDKEIDTLLTKWRTWHTGRVLGPLVASGILIWSALDLLPL